MSEDQKALVTTVGAFARKESPVTRLRRLREDPLGFERATFQKMGEYGWLGVMFPEDVGGSGGSFVDAALVLEQLGSTLVPEPVIPAFVAGTAILRAGSPEQKQRFITPLAAGRDRAQPGLRRGAGPARSRDVTDPRRALGLRVEALGREALGARRPRRLGARGLGPHLRR